MQPVLSIVIVEYHSIEEVNLCIESIHSNIGISCEVVISSNSQYSKDKQKDITNSKKPNIKWIFNARNGGFAYAMNEGLKVCNGEYLVIMNSDCRINFDLSEMVQFLSNHQEIGALGPRIHDADGNLQDTARPYVSLPRFIWRQSKRIIQHKVSILNPQMDYTKTQTVDWVIGAFIMVSRKAYEMTSGLDESFFMYAEDLDWCTRIRQNGLEIVYYANSDITYKGTRRARNNKKYAKIFLKSHLLFWEKYGFWGGYPKRKHIIYDNK